MIRTRAFFLSLLLCSPAQFAMAQPTYDVVIRGGTIFDGAGAAPFKGDVAIKGGHIVAVGDVGAATAANMVDATGLYVAPGFINIHAHAEADAMATAVNMLTQGVTTEFTNADGGGETDIAKQMGQFAAKGLAENIGAYIGFNAAWNAVVGKDDRRPTPAQIEAMQRILAENLGKGAWGVSAGLDYRPAFYARADEVAQVVSVAKAWRTNFPNHDRLPPDQNLSSFIAVQETIAIGEQAGVAPVVTHIKSQGAEQGKAGQIIAAMAAATARGARTFADLYPYTAGNTGLSAFFIPGWAGSGGRDAMLKHLQDPASRAKIIAYAEEGMRLRLGSHESIYFPETGRKLTDYMADWNVGPGEAVMRLLEKSEMSVIMNFGSDADVVAFLRYPDTAVACDCGATLRERVHPRQYGSFPKVLEEYVRDRQVISWEEAIRKMTGLPAGIVGLVDRGYLAPGMRADVTLFDPARIQDNATYEAPAKRSEGVTHVFVNGVQALRDGAPTGAKGGVVLSRTREMPTRGTPTGARALAGAARGDGYALKFSIRQGGSDRWASGELEMVEKGRTWRAERLGVVQSAAAWASVTAVLTDGSGARRPATLIVDGIGGPAAVVHLGLDGADAVRLAADALSVGS